MTYGSGTYGAGTYGAGAPATPPAGGLASRPTLSLRLALTTDPTATPSWTAIPDDLVQAFSSRRGRAHEWDRVATGTATTQLTNQDRRFDPTHAAGPYFGALRPMRRAQVRVTYNGVTYDVFTGFVRGWPQRWAAQGQAAVAPLQLVDGFHVLARVQLNTTYPQELSSERVKRVLADANWGVGQAWVLGDSTFGVLGTTTILAPTGDQEIGVGVSTIQGGILTDALALEHLLAIAFENEHGRLFIGRNGAVVFQGRHLAINEARYTTSQATWGDGGLEDGATGALPYADLELDYDEDQIENDIRLQRVGGSVQTATDSISQTRYYPRTHRNTGLLLTSDSEVASAATWRLSRRKEPAVRIVGMRVRPARAPEVLWPVVLGAELGDRWTIKRRPPGGGETFSQEAFVESIEHTATPSDWQVWFRLAPADTTTYWVLGHPTAAVLGTTTRLAY